VNPKVAYIDQNGAWGYEDGGWCGIGELNYDTKIRIKNQKTQEFLITNLYSDNTIVLLVDCNHSECTYQNEQLLLDATGKCLNAMNSRYARMTDCNNGDDQINHHIHFKFIDNNYICIKNNVDPSDYCLDSSTLKFETSKSEYSKWHIERLNKSKIIDSIEEVIAKSPNLKPEPKTIIKPKSTTTTTDQTSTSAPEATDDCYSKVGYLFCSPGNTQIAYMIRMAIGV